MKPVVSQEIPKIGFSEPMDLIADRIEHASEIQIIMLRVLLDAQCIAQHPPNPAIAAPRRGKEGRAGHGRLLQRKHRLHQSLEHSVKRGHQPLFSNAAIQVCPALKAQFSPETAALDWPIPDFSTLRQRQKTLILAIPCQPVVVGTAWRRRPMLWRACCGVYEVEGG